MKTIKVSDEVWNEIAKRGKFGETEDDVLRRDFGLLPSNSSANRSPTGRRGRGNVTYSTNRMTSRVERRPGGDYLLIEFASGERKEWRLSDKSDKDATRDVRDAAIEFALSCGATDPGQTNAVRKTLTNAEYYLTK